MKHFQWLLVLVLTGGLLLGGASSLIAQTSAEKRPTTTSQHIFWQQLKTLYQWSGSLDTNRPMPDSMFQLDCKQQAQPEMRRAEELRARSKGVGEATGLEFRARFEYETELGQFGNTGQTDFDEIAGGLSGTYAGLQWNLLGGGLVDYNREARLNELQAQQQQLQAQITQQRRRNRCRARRVQEQVNGLLIKLLEQKVQFGEQWAETVRQAYLEGDMELEELLSAQQEIETARRQLHSRRRNFRARPVRQLSQLPPLVRLNFEKLEQQVKNDDRLSRIQKMGHQIADQQDAGQLGTQLALFGRYEFDQRQDNGNQRFVGEGMAAGIQLSQPLGGADRHPEDHQKATRDAEIAYQRSEWIAGLATVQQRMMEDRTRAADSYYRSLRWRERLRASLANHRLQEGQLGEAIYHAAQLVDATIEYIKAIGEVYEEVGRAFEASRQPLDLSLVQMDTLSTINTRGRTGTRSLYIWSDGFRKHSNEFWWNWPKPRTSRL